MRALKHDAVHWNIMVAHDGLEALDYLFGKGKYAGRDTTKLPDLVLLDLKMDRIDGFEVLRRIRADERTMLLRVIVLTSSRLPIDLLYAYRFGCNSFIRKPVNFDEFSAVVRQLGHYWLATNESPPSARKSE